MSYELKGKLLEKFETQQVTDTFRKREFVIEKSEEANGRVFTNTIKFQLTQDRSSLLDDFEPGDEMTVHFDIRGNRWERDGRVNYFTNLEAWRLQKAEAFVDQDPGLPSADQEPPQQAVDSGEEYSDDLPF